MPANIKKKILIVLVITLIFFGGSFYYFLTKVQPSFPEEPIFEEIKLELWKEEKPVITCQSFEPISNEVTCQEAIELALKEYPGEIYFIDRTEVELTGEGETQSIKYSIWLIKINFKEVVSMPEKLPGMEKVGYVEIGVDRKTKEILVLGYGPPYE